MVQTIPAAAKRAGAGQSIRKATLLKRMMYPKPMTYNIEKPATLREFISTLGEHTLYAYDRRVIGVVVNEKRLWDSARLKPGDKVTIYPIIVGG